MTSKTLIKLLATAYKPFTKGTLLERQGKTIINSRSSLPLKYVFNIIVFMERIQLGGISRLAVYFSL